MIFGIACVSSWPAVRDNLYDLRVVINGISSFSLHNHGIALVLRSENAKFSPGDHIYGLLDFVEYAVLNDLADFRIVDNKKEGLPWSAYVGAVGMPGMSFTLKRTI